MHVQDFYLVSEGRIVLQVQIIQLNEWGWDVLCEKSWKKGT